MKVKGKMVIVTGASSGIGLATAKLLAQKGAKVALVARSKAILTKISKKLPDSMVVPADMTHENEIKNMVKMVNNHYGRVDILINNAGRGYDAAIEYVNTKLFYQLFDLDLVGPLIAMQQVIPLMRKQGEGAIVNISSGTSLMFLPNLAAYSSLKRALVGLSLTAREELKKDKISVSVVYPYITATNFEKNTIKDPHLQEWENSGDDFQLPAADSAEYVAGKILFAIESGKPKIFAHDWMNRSR